MGNIIIVKTVTVISNEVDLIYLNTTLQSPFPYEDSTVVRIQAPYRKGLQYCRENFTGIPYKEVDGLGEISRGVL